MFNWFVFGAFLAIFSCVEAQVSTLQKSDFLIKDGLYADAASLLEETMKTQSDPAIQEKLVQAYFGDENFAGVISLLKKVPPHTNDLLLLLGISYINIGQPQSALEPLNNVFKSDPNSLVSFQLGKAYFFNGNSEEAKKFLNGPKLSDGEIYILAQVYLAKITLLEKNKAHAEKILNDLNPLLKPQDSMQYEISFLRGQLYFQSGEYSKAAEFFEKALPRKNAEKTAWYNDTLYHLAWSYLKLGDDSRISQATQKDYLTKAESAFLTLGKLSSEEKVNLSLGQYYLIRAARLNEPDAYDKAENLLSRSDSFKTNEGQTEALLLRAQAASTYEERDKLFRQLALEYPKSAKGWYLKGLNDFEEGKIQKDQAAEFFVYFDRSIEAFAKAFHLFKSESPAQAALTAKYQALANDNQNKPTAALAVLDNLIDIYPTVLKQMDHPDEIFHLKALIAAKLSQIPIAEEALKIVLEKYPEGKYFDDSLNFLGLLKFRQGLYQEALKNFQLLAEQHPNSPLAGDALAMAANCCDHLNLDGTKSQEFRKQCFEYYPGCSLAPEAYFNYFTYRDYLQGDRVSMKHLLGFTSLYPNHPLLLNTHYLIGLDQTRDRKSQEGKWIRKKNLTSAIDSFLEVETHFDQLHQKQLLPSDNLEYYISLKYRATLERALANLSIADESLGAKRQIYLAYAEEVLKQLKQDFENHDHPLTKYLSLAEPLPSLFEENLFWLAQCYLKMPDQHAGKEILNLMLEKYRTSKITRGYFLSRVWYEKGMLALSSNEYSLALQSFLNAEDAAKGKVLSTDQKLDLWIQQSMCYQGLDQLNQAILILSKVVNDDAVSGLRLKAMYMRAENYERQGRLDLARKQLEATSKKGGEWALKSKNKLDKDYGYQ